MSKRVDCPVCGARCNANQFERNGCWSCTQDAERAEVETEFSAFMAHDEETRWRALWEAANRPSA